LNANENGAAVGAAVVVVVTGAAVGAAVVGAPVYLIVIQFNMV